MEKPLSEPLQLGDSLPSRTLHVSAKAISSLVSLLGIRTNRRFVDEDVARAQGLPGIIAPGNLSVQFLLHALCEVFGHGSVRKLEVDFRRPVVAGDRLRLEAIVVELSWRDGEMDVELDLCLRNQEGVPTSRGRASLLLAREEA